MRTTYVALALSASLLAVPACRPKGETSDVLDSTDGASDRLTADNLFEYMVYESSDPRYVGYAKVSWPLAEGGQLSGQWIQSRDLKFHADFLKTQAPFQGLTSAQIDQIALNQAGRRVFLGVMLIRRLENSNAIDVDLEILGHDPITPEQVSRIFARLRSTHGEYLTSLSYAPVAEQRDYVNANLPAFQAAGITVADRAEPEGRLCYASGWGVGRVRMVKAADLPQEMIAGTVTANDILVLDETPREIPIVAGVVVAQPSSPSSHVALLSQMAGNPFIYEKQAFDSPKWRALADSEAQIAFMSRGEGAYCAVTIVPTTDLPAEDALRLVGLKRPNPITLPSYDAALQTPLNLDTLGRGDGPKVGAKAANVAELRRIIPEHTVEKGLGVPLGAFARYLSDGRTEGGQSIKDAIAADLALATAAAAPMSVVIPALERIRKTIEGGELPAALKQDLVGSIETMWPQGTRVKLRSSSNVEDSKDFNGAGLYDSKGACVGDDARTTGSNCEGETKPQGIAKAAKKVWASLYTLKGFMARRYYGIDEAKAAMGLLVQASFKNELANGVVITTQKPGWAGDDLHFKAAMVGFPGEDLEVTNPPVGKVPESTLITEGNVERQIPTTELPTGRMIMTDEQYQSLWSVTKRVHEHYAGFLPEGERSSLSLDMEWKLTSDGDVIVKQVRPVPPSGQTAGLKGKGAFTIGNRTAGLFCPSTLEDDRGLARLLTSTALKAEFKLHEIPLSATSIPNPILSLQANVEGTAFTPLTMGQTAKVTADEWRSYDGTRESRSVSVCVPVTWPQPLPNQSKVQLCWMSEQSRLIVAKDYIETPVGPLHWSRMELTSSKLPDDAGASEAYGQPYVFVEGATKCEAEAWQGEQPGTRVASESWRQDREPRSITTKYKKVGSGTGVNLTIAGRTSTGGLDKTSFQHVDSFCISGLLAQELCVKAPQRAVYAPAHHNFEWQFAADLYAAEGLTTANKKLLDKKKVRYVVVPEGSTSTGYKVNGYSKTFVKKSLGTVQLEIGQ